MRRLLITIALALLCVPLVGGAQGTSRDSTIARAIKTARDSVACVVAPKSAADRCSRARLRLDSLRTAVLCTVPLRPTIPAGGWFCPSSAPPPEPYDSTVIVTLVMSRDSLVVGDSGAVVCAYFTTKSGKRGLASPLTFVNNSTIARVDAHTDTSDAPCLTLFQQRGVVLTSGLARRPGTITVGPPFH